MVVDIQVRWLISPHVYIQKCYEVTYVYFGYTRKGLRVDRLNYTQFTLDINMLNNISLSCIVIHTETQNYYLKYPMWYTKCYNVNMLSLNFFTDVEEFTELSC